jgi:PadR family transcriptional regulator, regulatory protein PadR
MSPADKDLAALRKGSAEMMILALLEVRARHGYEIAKQIEAQSGSVLQMHVASLYPILYRLEKRGFIAGKWVEKPGVRRRRYYSITAAGKKELAKQRASWSTFWQALCQVAGLENA